LSKEESTTWYQTWLKKNRELLEFVYQDSIQNITRTALSTLMANVSVEKQRAFEETQKHE
jgi:hypothetical protein